MVLLLIGFGTVGFLESPNAFLIAVAVIGGACAALAQWGPRRMRRVISGLVIEEICISAVALGSSPYQHELLVRSAIFVLALALAGALLLRLPLPERNLPLRGDWLRRMLAAVALLGLLQGGPFQYVWERWLPLALYSGPAAIAAPSPYALLAAVAAGACLLPHAWAFLVRGLGPRSAEARPATS